MILYKKGQGTIVRWCAFLTILAIVLFGCYTLYIVPPKGSWWWEPLWGQEILKQKIVVRPILFPSVVLFLATAVVIVWYLNRPKVADFLVETEGELRKVSWPPRKEFVGSSLVVLVVIVFVSMFLYFVDEILSVGLQRLGIGF